MHRTSRGGSRSSPQILLAPRAQCNSECRPSSAASSAPPEDEADDPDADIQRGARGGGDEGEQGEQDQHRGRDARGEEHARQDRPRLERCITSFDEIKGGDLKTLDAVVKQIDKLPADAKILTRGDAAVEDEIWDAAGDVELHTSEAIGRKPGRRPSPSGVRKGGKSPSSKQSSKAAAAEAAGRAYTHKQALAHGVKDGCIDSSMSSGAAASMVM